MERPAVPLNARSLIFCKKGTPPLGTIPLYFINKSIGYGARRTQFPPIFPPILTES